METLLSHLNIPDAAVVIVLVLGLLGGIRRGLSGELLRVVTIILAIIAGWKGADPGAAWLAARTDWEPTELRPIAFFGIIIAAYLVMGIFRVALRLFLDFSFKGVLEWLGGAVIGVLRAALFSVVVLLGASLMPSEPVQETLRQSASGQWVLEQVRPRYDAWAEQNPEFKLPALKRDEAGRLDTPAWENFLGPLIDRDDHGGE
ncbi:MAG TPA: CvpA family protein [Kiritimatiellia bacterium]|nr:CvpA family protein [Kiritimatiellia bacterium]HMO99290.1 CvpA family protein [Kiritimatiellia bacterium]HMP95622.1 CvpA family protein [Kiritimatiellia bacterium]